MKTALLVVSFGTTHEEALEGSIVPTEQALAAAFPEMALVRAFTSAMVRRRLAARGISVDSVEEALARITREGFQKVLVQPTLVIPGREYDLLARSVRDSSAGVSVTLGEPLLRGEADFGDVLAGLRQAYPVGEDTVLVAVGHGTHHDAGALYGRLASYLAAAPGAPVRLTTVEGAPSFADTVRELTALPQRKALLAPLLFVAGEHAKNDMAGGEPGSLRSLLEAAGFTADCSLRGLGAIPAFRQLYVRRAAAAAEAF